MKHLSLIFIAILSISSCSTYSEDEMNEFDEKIQAYIKKKKIDCEESGSGLYYRIDSTGDGEFIQAKDSVYITYKGSFLSGKTFENQKKPIAFRVDDLITGWKEVLYKLKEGGSAFIIIPPHLGYGDRKLDDIPENSILVYQLSVDKVI